MLAAAVRCARCIRSVGLRFRHKMAQMNDPTQCEPKSAPALPSCVPSVLVALRAVIASVVLGLLGSLVPACTVGGPHPEPPFREPGGEAGSAGAFSNGGGGGMSGGDAGAAGSGGIGNPPVACTEPVPCDDGGPDQESDGGVEEDAGLVDDDAGALH